MSLNNFIWITDQYSSFTEYLSHNFPKISSRIVNSTRRLVQDELLLDEWHSKISSSCSRPLDLPNEHCWELVAASDSDVPNIILSGFPWGYEYPRTFGHELVGTWEDKFVPILTHFFSFLLLHPFRHRFCNSSKFNKGGKLFHSSRVKFSLWSICLRVGVWCQCIEISNLE